MPATREAAEPANEPYRQSGTETETRHSGSEKMGLHLDAETGVVVRVSACLSCRMAGESMGFSEIPDCPRAWSVAGQGGVVVLSSAGHKD